MPIIPRDAPTDSSSSDSDNSNSNSPPKKVLKSKDPDYHKNYYKAHKDKVGVHTPYKYARLKYGVSKAEYEIYGEEDIYDYGKYLKLRAKLVEKYPDQFTNV